MSASNVALSENNRKNAVVKETLLRDKTSRKKGLHIRKKGYIARLENNFIVVRRRKRKKGDLLFYIKELQLRITCR